MKNSAENGKISYEFGIVDEHGTCLAIHDDILQAERHIDKTNHRRTSLGTDKKHGLVHIEWRRVVIYPWSDSLEEYAIDLQNNNPNS